MDKTTQDNIDRICDHDKRIANIRASEKRKKQWTKAGKYFTKIRNSK